MSGESDRNIKHRETEKQKYGTKAQLVKKAPIPEPPKIVVDKDDIPTVKKKRGLSAGSRNKVVKQKLPQLKDIP